MQRTSTTLTRLALGALAVLFAWNVYRAVTQSVTPGEAWNYDQYIGPGWHESLARFGNNNHFLNTLLVKTSTARIHLTEFSMRLPSLLFGVLYLWAIYRLARRWFGRGAMFLAVVGLLALNPLVVDAMSEARGYGMGLAAWMWALSILAEGSTPAFAGVLLGMSVAASLAFVTPVVALLLAAAAYRRGGLGYVPQVAGLTAFVLLAVPLNHAEMTVVTQGATSLRQTLNSLAAGSFSTGNAAVATAARIGAGLLAALGLGVGLLGRRRAAAIVYLCGGSFLLSLVLMLAAHRWAHAALPEGGAIFLVPMITLFVAGLVTQWGREWAQIVFVVFGALCVAHYADHLQLPYLAAGRLSGGKQLAEALRTDAGNRSVRIGVSEDAEGIVRYYKWRYRQANWEAIERPSPAARFDYYVLTAADVGLVEQEGLHVVYRDAGLVLAR